MTRAAKYGVTAIMLVIYDVYWRQTQRPELPWHSFGPVRDFDRRYEAVYVFRKVIDEGRRLMRSVA